MNSKIIDKVKKWWNFLIITALVLLTVGNSSNVSSAQAQVMAPLASSCGGLLFSDDFSTSKGWTDLSNGYIVRDSTNQRLNWTAARSHPMRYYIPVSASSDCVQLNFRFDVTSAAGNGGIFIGLAENLDAPANIWGIDATGAFLGIDRDTAYGYKIAFASTYSDGTFDGVNNQDSKINYGGFSQWRKVSFTIDHGNWTVVVTTDGGSPVGQMNGTLSGQHTSYGYVMIAFEVATGWETETGYFDDIEVYGAKGADVSIEQALFLEATNDQGRPILPSETIFRSCVTNTGTLPVTGKITLYLNGQNIGQGTFPPPGEPLPPSLYACTNILLNPGTSSGKIVGAEIQAIAEIEGMIDINSQDNTYTDTVSIYWADFPLDRDGYSFENEGYNLTMFLDDISVLPLSVGEIALITSRVLANYFIGGGGHCFGMSSTSLIYREHPELRPVPYNTTYSILPSDAWPMIKKYQRNQLIMKPWFHPTIYSANLEFQHLLGYLDQSTPQPVQIELKNSSDAYDNHAVVAYKAIKFSNDTYLYFYDNNHPFESPQLNSLPSIESDGFIYKTYDQFYVNQISPLPDDVAILAAKKIANIYLTDNKLISIFTKSLSDVIVTNASGKQIGYVNGSQILNISGANMWKDGDRTVFQLPNNSTYTITILVPSSAVTSQTLMMGQTDIGYAIPMSNGSILDVSFSSIDTTVGGSYSTKLSTDPLIIDPLHLPGGTTLPPSNVKAEQVNTFFDVPTNYWSWNYIERLFASGITGGCTTSPLNYCPSNSVNRAQMAVFLLRAEHGDSYTPPAATGFFDDVPASDWTAPWIEQLAKEGITGGCGGGKYCPGNAVTRAQMAIFLLRAEHGSNYAPPSAVGIFSDVIKTDFTAPFIEQLANEQITGGCGGGKYCPANPVTRDQMSVFLVRTFKLP